MKNNIFENIRLRHVVLVLVIIVSMLRVVYVSQCVKEGYHSDEVWSYGLANSYYNPFLYTKADVFDNNNDNLQNMNNWMSSQVIMDYLSVQEGQQFSYDSVWYNQSQDQLPPLYYAVLHTVCSLFPNKFTFWFGLGVNLFFLPLTLMLLYKTANMLFENKNISAMVCAFYGLCTGCLYTHLFIRMYAMTTFMLMLGVYMHVRVLKSVKITIKDMCILCAVTALGALTHYVYLFFMFFYTAGNCIILLCKKRWVDLLKYAVSVLLGVGILLLAFPTVITQMTGRDGNLGHNFFSMPTRIVAAFLLNVTTREVFGVGTPIYKNVIGLYVIGIFGFLCICLLLIYYLFRNEAFMKSIVENIRESIKNLWNRRKGIFQDNNYFICAMILGIIGETFIVMVTTYIIAMKVYSDRYVFCVYPIVCLTVIYVIEKILTGLKYGHKLKMYLLAGIIFLLVAFNFGDYASNNFYVFSYEKEGVGLEDIPQDSDVIVALPVPWLMVTYPQYIKDMNQIYYWNIFPYEEMNKDLKELPDDGKPVYLLYDSTYSQMYEVDGEFVDELEVNNFFGMEIPEGVEATNIKTHASSFKFSSEDIFAHLRTVKGVNQIDEVGFSSNYGRPVKIYRLR